MYASPRYVIMPPNPPHPPNHPTHPTCIGRMYASPRYVIIPPPPTHPTHPTYPNRIRMVVCMQVQGMLSSPPPLNEAQVREKPRRKWYMRGASESEAQVRKNARRKWESCHMGTSLKDRGERERESDVRKAFTRPCFQFPCIQSVCLDVSMSNKTRFAGNGR